MRSLITGLVLVAFAAAPPHASACTAGSPSPVLSIAIADLAVVAQVTAMQNGTATVKITRAIKGSATPGESIQVHGAPAETLLTQLCNFKGLAPGKSYVLLLWNPAGALNGYHLISSEGGIADASAEKQYTDALAQNHPRSPWKRNENLMTQLVLSPTRANNGDLDLFVVFRNIGEKPITFAYRDLPLASKSKCTLDVVNVATGNKVAAVDVPISKTNINEYFSKHGREYDISIEPGAAHLLALRRITTAESGWGHKEELGFVYYPINAHGMHTVAATCSNLFENGPVISDVIRLPL